MRLASFNVLHGRSLDDGEVSTERLTAACATLEADVLCLQEIDRAQARSGNVDQTAEVARALGAASWRFEPAIMGEPGGIWRAAAGDDWRQPDAGYGVGIVSRLPVSAWHVIRLRASRIKAPVAVPGGRGRFIMLPDEPRVVLGAEITVGEQPFIVATTHLSFVMGYNLAQLRRVTRALAGAGHPCVLMGDFNLPGGVPRWASGWRPLASIKTYPADRPRLQIDHALAHGAVPPVTAAEARRLPLSDHRALVVDLGDN